MPQPDPAVGINAASIWSAVRQYICDSLHIAAIAQTAVEMKNASNSTHATVYYLIGRAAEMVRLF